MLHGISIDWLSSDAFYSYCYRFQRIYKPREHGTLQRSSSIRDASFLFLSTIESRFLFFPSRDKDSRRRERWFLCRQDAELFSGGVSGIKSQEGFSRCKLAAYRDKGRILSYHRVAASFLLGTTTFRCSLGNKTFPPPRSFLFIFLSSSPFYSLDHLRLRFDSSLSLFVSSPFFTVSIPFLDQFSSNCFAESPGKLVRRAVSGQRWW